MVGSEITLSEGSLVAPADVPRELLDELHKTSDVLQGIGFCFSHIERREEVQAAIDIPRWVMILRHESGETYAEVSSNPMPDALIPNRVTFLSFYQNADVITQNIEPVSEFAKSKSLYANYAVTPDIQEQWAEHQSWLAQLKEDDIGLGDLHSPTPKDYAYRLKATYLRHYNACVEEGRLARAESGFRFPAVYGFKLLQQIVSGFAVVNKARKEWLASCRDDDLVDISALETDAFLRDKALNANSIFSRQMKWWIFAASAVFFLLFIGLVFSWGFVLAIVPVLLFHELGHFLAMRLFSYKDLYLFFVPIGAVVMGKKKDATAWQEAIVLLAGPVPGIVAATLVLVLFPERAEWVTELCTVSLILNYFNLLPIPPLDGGRIMQLVLFDRYLWLRVLAKVGSILSFGLSAWFFLDPVLGFLSLFLLYAAYSDFRLWRLQRSLQNEVSGEAGEVDYVRSVFQALASRRMLFVEKLQLVKQLAGVMPRKLPRAAVASSIFAVYALVILAPAVGAGSVLLAGSFTELAAVMTGSYFSTDYWEEQLAESSDPSERVTLMIMAAGVMSEDDPVAARNFMYRATEESRLTDDPDLLARAYTSYLSFLLESDDVDAAVAAHKALSSELEHESVHLVVPTIMMLEMDDVDRSRTHFAKAVELTVRHRDMSGLISTYLSRSGQYADNLRMDSASGTLEDGLALLGNKFELGEDVCAPAAFADAFLRIGQRTRAEFLLSDCASNGKHYEKATAMSYLMWFRIADREYAQAEQLLARTNSLYKVADKLWNSDVPMHSGEFLNHAGMSNFDWQFQNNEAELVLAHQAMNVERYTHAFDQLLSTYDESMSREEFIESYRLYSEFDESAIEGIVEPLVLDALREPVLNAASMALGN